MGTTVAVKVVKIKVGESKTTVSNPLPASLQTPIAALYPQVFPCQIRRDIFSQKIKLT
jgi:hypothetical protein